MPARNCSDAARSTFILRFPEKSGPLAVAPSRKESGIGRLLVEALESEAIHNDLHAIFAFTYIPDFFRKLGFHQVDRGLLSS